MNMVYFFKSDEDTNRRWGPGPTMNLWYGLKHKRYVQSDRPATTN
jgi:hypothetical protein